MATQSEAALEQGLIRTLQNMSYEFVQIDEETNLHNNFKRQLELHNQRTLNQVGRSELTDKEFERVMIHLAGGTRFEKAKKLRNLFALDLDDGQRVWLEFLNTQKWVRTNFKCRIKSQSKGVENAVMMSPYSSTVCRSFRLN